MTSAVTHPLVSAYLRDLEMLLRGIDPGERAEVLAGVHEHLDASLPPSASDDDVRRALAELGSPQSVADEAYAGRPASASAPVASREASSWTAIVATSLNAGCVLFMVLLIATSTAHPAELAFSFVVFFLPWMVICVLTGLSGTWSHREKIRSILLLPATLVVLTLAIWIALTMLGPHVINLVIALTVVGVAGWQLVKLARSTTR